MTIKHAPLFREQALPDNLVADSFYLIKPNGASVATLYATNNVDPIVAYPLIGGGGGVTTPNSVTANNLVMFGDSSGDSLADAGIGFGAVNSLIQAAPVFARDFGVQYTLTEPSDAVKEANLIALQTANQAAMAINVTLQLEHGNIWLKGSGSAVFRLGETIFAMGTGSGWDSTGFCRIFVDDMGAFPLVNFIVDRPTGHLGAVNQKNFHISKNIAFITGGDGVHVRIGDPSDDADQIFYNKVEFDAGVLSNTDGPNHKLLQLHSQYDVEIGGEIISAGATTPTAGSIAIEVINSSHSSFTGTIGGIDKGIILGNGVDDFRIYGDFEQSNTALTAMSGSSNTIFAPHRGTATETIVDARLGSTGEIVSNSIQREGNNPNFQILKRESTIVDWKRRDEKFTPNRFTGEYTFNATNDPILICQIPIAADENAHIEFTATQQIGSGGAEVFRVFERVEIFASRDASNNIVITDSGTAIHSDKSFGALSFAVNNGLHVVEFSITGTANSTYKYHHYYQKLTLGNEF